MSEIRMVKPMGFEDLDVFKKSYAISLEIHKASLGFPKTEQYALAGQIRRASKSICANIAEGFGKQSRSKSEFARFLSMALGSCDEMQVWVKYCIDLQYVTEVQGRAWKQAYQEVARMLNGLIKSIS